MSEDSSGRDPFFYVAQQHYADRCAAFKAENGNFQTVVMVGDSITEGFDLPRFFPYRRIINRGIGADTIGYLPRADDRRGVIFRLAESIFDCHASHAFLLIGINDLGDLRTPQDIVSRYREMLQIIKAMASRTVIHVQSLLPTSKDFASRKSSILEVNHGLRSLAQEMGYAFLDLHPLFCTEQGELREDLTEDGLHINDAGYAIWKSAVDREMNW